MNAVVSLDLCRAHLGRAHRLRMVRSAGLPDKLGDSADTPISHDIHPSIKRLHQALGEAALAPTRCRTRCQVLGLPSGNPRGKEDVVPIDATNPYFAEAFQIDP